MTKAILYGFLVSALFLGLSSARPWMYLDAIDEDGPSTHSIVAVAVVSGEPGLVTRPMQPSAHDVPGLEGYSYEASLTLAGDPVGGGGEAPGEWISKDGTLHEGRVGNALLGNDGAIHGVYYDPWLVGSFVYFVLGSADGAVGGQYVGHYTDIRYVRVNGEHSGVVMENLLTLVTGSPHVALCEDRVVLVATVGPPVHELDSGADTHVDASDLLWLHDPKRHVTQACECANPDSKGGPGPLTEGDFIGVGYDPHLVRVGKQWVIISLRNDFDSRRTVVDFYLSPDMVEWTLDKALSGTLDARFGYGVAAHEGVLCLATRSMKADDLVLVASVDFEKASLEVDELPYEQLKLSLSPQVVKKTTPDGKELVFRPYERRSSAPLPPLTLYLGGVTGAEIRIASIKDDITFEIWAISTALPFSAKKIQ